MQLRPHAILKAVYLSTTFFLALFTFHSANVYLTVYEAIENFDIPTPQLKLTFLDASHASAETTMTLLNPSRTKIEVLQVLETISLNSEFITTANLGLKSKSLEIDPMSEINVTIKAEIPSSKIHWVTSNTRKTWFIQARIVLNAEIVGKFSRRQSWFIINP